MVIQHNWELFTKEEDAQLLALHQELGNKWKRIGELSAMGRNRNEVKTRIHFLVQSKENDDHMLEEGSGDEAPQIAAMQTSDRILPQGHENFAVTLARFLDTSLNALEQLHRAVDRAGH